MRHTEAPTQANSKTVPVTHPRDTTGADASGERRGLIQITPGLSGTQQPDYIIVQVFRHTLQ